MYIYINIYLAISGFPWCGKAYKYRGVASISGQAEVAILPLRHGNPQTIQV